MRRRALILVVTAAVCAPPAEAAEISRARECVGEKGCSIVIVVRYRSAPGEASDVTVRHVDGTFVFTDRAPLAAPRGCSARSDHEVVCPAYRAEVHLDDGPDVAAVEGAFSLSVHGGPGDDHIAATGPWSTAMTATTS
jgi:hypothetical protein